MTGRLSVEPVVAWCRPGKGNSVVVYLFDGTSTARNEVVRGLHDQVEGLLTIRDIPFDNSYFNVVAERSLFVDVDVNMDVLGEDEQGKVQDTIRIERVCNWLCYYTIGNGHYVRQLPI